MDRRPVGYPRRYRGNGAGAGSGVGRGGRPGAARWPGPRGGAPRPSRGSREPGVRARLRPGYRSRSPGSRGRAVQSATARKTSTSSALAGPQGRGGRPRRHRLRQRRRRARGGGGGGRPHRPRAGPPAAQQDEADRLSRLHPRLPESAGPGEAAPARPRRSLPDRAAARLRAEGLGGSEAPADARDRDHRRGAGRRRPSTRDQPRLGRRGPGHPRHRLRLRPRCAARDRPTRPRHPSLAGPGAGGGRRMGGESLSRFRTSRSSPEPNQPETRGSTACTASPTRRSSASATSRTTSPPSPRAPNGSRGASPRRSSSRTATITGGAFEDYAEPELEGDEWPGLDAWDPPLP